MKKISPQKYAQVLYDMVADRKQEEIDSVVREFARLVVENNDLSRVDAIIKEFSRLWNHHHGIVESEVVSARQLEPSLVEELKNFVQEVSGGRQVEFKNRVDENILGGVIIRYGDKRIDGSLKTQISKLRTKLYS